MSETVLRLVVLVVVIVGGPGCVQLVQSIVFVIEFLCAWSVLCISIGCLMLIPTIGMVCHVGHYGYH